MDMSAADHSWVKRHTSAGSKLQSQTRIWKCECGNEDQGKILTAADGEVVCAICGAVLGCVARAEEEPEQTDSWDPDADACRKILEDRVSKRGWQF